MNLDEANALAESLLCEETVPSRRARLVALKLALGYPHALDVSPSDLALLRRREAEASLSVWRARVWLGSASILAFVWNAGGVLFWATLSLADDTLFVVLSAFLLGLGHAAAGLIQAWGSGEPNARVLGVMAWMWLCGPLFSAAVCIGFDVNALVCGLMLAAPSIFVSLAASQIARHTLAR